MTTLKLFLLSTIMLLNLEAEAQYNLEWGGVISEPFGATAVSRIYSSCFDNDSNIVITGSFQGGFDFDMGPSTQYRYSNGGYDIFILKLDKNGNFIWVKTLGATGCLFCHDSGNDIAIDSVNNIYVSGKFFGPTDFDPSPGGSQIEYSSNPWDDDDFLLKLDSSGDFQWVNAFSSNVGTGVTSELELNELGEIYFLTSYYDSIDADPSNVDLFFESDGNYTENTLITKFDGSGDLFWAYSLQGGFNHAMDFIIDNNSNLLITGEFRDIVDFDPITGVNELNSFGNNNAFILELDTDANLNFVLEFENNSGGIYPKAVYRSSANDLIIAGFHKGTSDFNPGINSNSETAVNTNGDGFIVRLDGSGNYQENFVFGTSGIYNDICTSVGEDNSGDLYFSGQYQNSVDFDPSPAVNSLTSNGLLNGFVLKTSSNLDYIDVFSLGGSSVDGVGEIHIRENNEIYVFGFANSQGWDLNPSPASFIVENGLFIAKMIEDTCQYITDTHIITACETYTWIDGNTYTSPNNSAIWTVQNSVGCDSVITLNLTILNPTTSQDLHVACDSYTWINGITYTNSNNTAQWVLDNANSNGCDSVVNLDLIIENINVNVSITDGVTITANLSGASYQWIDCDNNNEEMIGEISQSFTATTNSNYAVIITNGNCSDTSNCILIDQVGLNPDVQKIVLSIYPNPSSSGIFILDYEGDIVKLIVTDMQGRRLKSSSNIDSGLIDLSKLTSGNYLIHCYTDQGIIVKEVMIVD